MKRCLLIAASLFALLAAQAQESERTYRHFATQTVQQTVLASDESFAANLSALEDHVAAYGQAGNDRSDVVPVVFHILYKEGCAYPSAEQVQAQLAVLDQCYGPYAQPELATAIADVVAFAEMGVGPIISFCLPGAELGGGTNFVKTEVDEWPLDNSMESSLTGGADAWDPEHYLNIWVCELKTGTAGYAQMPGGPPATDGIVLDYDYLLGYVAAEGYPYGGGKSLAHLVGSYLGLYELWDEEAPCTDDCLKVKFQTA